MNRTTIERFNGDNERTTWEFTLHIGYGGDSCIWLDRYINQTKESKRKRKWTTRSLFYRMDRRVNTMNNPPVPGDVISEMRREFADAIMDLPIKIQ